MKATRQRVNEIKLTHSNISSERTFIYNCKYFFLITIKLFYCCCCCGVTAYLLEVQRLCEVEGKVRLRQINNQASARVDYAHLKNTSTWRNLACEFVSLQGVFCYYFLKLSDNILSALDNPAPPSPHWIQDMRFPNRSDLIINFALIVWNYRKGFF